MSEDPEMLIEELLLKYSTNKTKKDSKNQNIIDDYPKNEILSKEIPIINTTVVDASYLMETKETIDIIKSIVFKSEQRTEERTKENNDKISEFMNIIERSLKTVCALIAAMLFYLVVLEFFNRTTGYQKYTENNEDITYIKEHIDLIVMFLKKNGNEIVNCRN
jgi:hypothetical protein